jgi:DNA-3-methyladenine glycosylase II
MARVATAGVTPDYWDEACRHLVKRDRVMKKLIPQFGEARLQSRGVAFTTLARSIVGQQISVKAAQSVWDKFAELTSGPSNRIKPTEVLGLEKAALREVGLSVRKVEYLSDLAQHFESGQVHVRQWAQMEDEAIIEELVAIRGIGRWTAEMFLIFHLERPDVLSGGDLGIRKAVQVEYGLEEMPPPARVLEIGDAWRPHRSLASLYLWESLAAVPD